MPTKGTYLLLTAERVDFGDKVKHRGFRTGRELNEHSAIPVANFAKKYDFEERSLSLGIYQLIGKQWSFVCDLSSEPG
jgi:hypothetical protein